MHPVVVGLLELQLVRPWNSQLPDFRVALRLHIYSNEGRDMLTTSVLQRLGDVLRDDL
jgi:hypothetical protein